MTGDGNSSAWIISDDESDIQDETSVPANNKITTEINNTVKRKQREVECIMLDGMYTHRCYSGFRQP